MSNLTTDLQQWGATGKMWPSNYAHQEGEAPVDAWENRFKSEVISNIKDDIIPTINGRLESSSSTTKPTSPEEGQLHWDSDNDNLAVYESASKTWKGVAMDSELNAHETDSTNPHLVTLDQAASEGASISRDVTMTGGADRRSHFDSGVTGDGAINAFWFTDQNATPVDTVKWHRDGAGGHAFAVINNSAGTTLFKITDTGTITTKGNTVWHAGNDGAGSGLDADTLDGTDSSGFAAANHNHDGTYVNEAGDSMTGSLGMNQNQITGFVMDKRTTDPTTPVVGQLWYRTDLD